MHMEMKKIAVIHTEFSEKFGIPRQSGLVETLQAEIVFEPEYRNEEALRGIEGYTHLWLLWEFSEAKREQWSPTVRPPRLGGNKRVGVFATRSPFRPNPIGLSCVRLAEVKKTKENGTVLIVSGADLLDGTPIYDIKPYLPYVDSHPEAENGFADPYTTYHLQVEFAAGVREQMTEAEAEKVSAVLAQDPRPSYQNDPERSYGMQFAGMELHFQVRDDVLTVTEVTHSK